MKGLVFGAGNIGRGFLGLLLGKAGFDTIFVDVDAGKVATINNQRQYPVFIVSSAGVREEIVQSMQAIHTADSESIEQAVVEADIILTAVGKDALKYLAPSLARGLLKRMKLRPRSDIHLVVVACENVQDNTTFLRDLVLQHVPVEDRDQIDAVISFPNCVVDRIVPNTLPVDGTHSLAVAVEEYFQLAIDKEGLRGAFPAIPGIDISTDLSATLEQKLCTLNMAHAIVGYYGYLKKYQYVHEAVGDKDIVALLHGALDEVGMTIATRHKNIPLHTQEAYAAKVVERFRNPYLRDEITRVARQPERKLGAEDRLIRPATLTWEQGRIPAFLASGITAALHYDYSGDAQAQSLISNIRERGIEHVLHEVSGLSPDSEMGRLVKSDFLLRAL
jgi:mannitol-1-phosphate 5-dehydrogenase